MKSVLRASLLAFLTACASTQSATPSVVADHVDLTWMSVTNMYFDLGTLGVLADGYVSRLPKDNFFGPGGGLGQTHTSSKPDSVAVARMLDALGGPSKVQVLLTGHSHFDHSFDTGVWSMLTGARVIGSQTTCFQVFAQNLPRDRCTIVNGGERVSLPNGVTMWVIRWNHSGDPAVNPEQHNPVELSSIPRLDPATGGLRAGVAEDFPNGGGNRAYLFVVDGPQGRLSWLFTNSASTVDLAVPIVVDGVNYGAPIENLKAAMSAAGLKSLDLWIGPTGVALARLVVPVVNPKAFLPVHWDDFWSPFSAGVSKPYSDPATEAFLATTGVRVVRPNQYMDKWRLDRSGVHPLENTSAKELFGLR